MCQKIIVPSVYSRNSPTWTPRYIWRRCYHGGGCIPSYHHQWSSGKRFSSCSELFQHYNKSNDSAKVRYFFAECLEFNPQWCQEICNESIWQMCLVIPSGACVVPAFEWGYCVFSRASQGMWTGFFLSIKKSWTVSLKKKRYINNNFASIYFTFENSHHSEMFLKRKQL